MIFLISLIDIFFLLFLRNILKNGNYNNSKLTALTKKIVSQLYLKDKRLFFNVGSGDVNSPKGIVKYLGRLLLVNTKLLIMIMKKLLFSLMT